MRIALLALVSCAAFAQTPHYDVSDVHETKRGQSQSRLIIPGKFDFRGATLVELITYAYGIDEDMISGGPNWIGSKQFDVVASGNRTGNRDTQKLMMQSLLAERFNLKVHNEPKPMPVFVMTVAKKVLMKETSGEESDCKADQVEDNKIKVICKNMTMAAIAEQLHQMANGYFNHPVVDATGVEGKFDFSMTWTGRGALGTAPNSVSAFEAAEKQLGLKIEAAKRPIPVIVIDSVSDTPTPNEAGAEEKLAYKETEFEVADIKPSKPDAQTNARFLPNGRLDVQAMPLRDLIKIALNVDDNDRLVGPKWMESAKFDIVAKAPGGPPIDTLRLMLKNLLIERFKIETHTEEQPATVYAMTLKKGSSKLEKAAGTERAGCTGAAEGDMIVRTCKNTTMAQLAEDLPRFAGGYVIHPVVELTGLSGGYNFVLSWTPRGKLDALRKEGASAASSVAGGVALPSDPAGLSVFEALEKELGIKMDVTKKPMSVTVIDKLNPMPTEN